LILQFGLRGSMRQIQIGAWLVSMCSVIAACGGEKFANTESEEPAPTSSGSKMSGDTSGPPSSGGSDKSSSDAGRSGSAGTTSLGGAAGGGQGGSGGGSASGGGSSMDECARGEVSFRMLPGPDVPHDYYCDASCGTGWLTITDSAGVEAYPLFSACGSASCESCEVLPCAAAACLPTALTGEGRKLVWNGNYQEPDTCGQGIACQRASCVKAGKYRAKACVAVNAGSNGQNSGCMPKASALACAEAEFEFPGDSQVELVVSKLQ
jgi:hypothetical protein